ncbi:MAG: hypothetical protein HWE22_12250 [Flavobacteriales bacterium]|nr:hypothetical protein [Flavobacteriales bacterium]
MVSYFKHVLWIVATAALLLSCGDTETQKKKLDFQKVPSREVPTREKPLETEVDNDRIEIEKQLKEQARKDWPNDFVTQEYWVSKQLEDYKIMRSLPNNAIKAQAEIDFPLDFSTQKYWYHEQMQAKNRME